MLILFLLTFLLKKLLTSALIHLLKKQKEQKFYQKYNSRNFYILLQKNSASFFNGKLYKQIYGVDLGSLLGPKLTNAFLVYFEKNWLQNCASDFKLHYCRRYVDDIFVLFTSPEHLQAFLYILNSQRVI